MMTSAAPNGPRIEGQDALTPGTTFAGHRIEAGDRPWGMVDDLRDCAGIAGRDPRVGGRPFCG